MTLDLTVDAVTLTEQLVNIESVSRNEEAIADAVQAALEPLEHLTVSRHANTVVARTDLGRPERVVIAGHLDTVPVNGNLPARREGGILHGLGSCDMKGGVAVALKLAAGVSEPERDLTFIFYEAEEIEAEFNGLKLLSESHPELMQADFAILMEPSNAVVEAGCQGTLRVDVRTSGERAHTARSWMGVNAIHAASGILDRLNGYEAADPGDRRPGVPRGPERGVHPRGRGRQRAARRLRGRGQLPLRARPRRAGGRGVRPRVLRRVRRHGHRLRARCPARALRAGREGVRGGGRGSGQPQVRLDRRGPLQRTRRTRGQLRTRGPAAGAQADEHVPIEHIERCEQQLRTWLGA